MKELYDRIYNLIEDEAHEKGKPFTLGKFEGIGWLDYHYVHGKYDGIYPSVSLKQYDKTVNVYFDIWEGGKSPLDDYASVFGKTALGKGCIRIRKLTPERADALKELIQKVIDLHGIGK